MEYPYNGILFDYKREWNTDVHVNIDELWKHVNLKRPLYYIILLLSWGARITGWATGPIMCVQKFKAWDTKNFVVNMTGNCVVAPGKRLLPFCT